ncbi:MAG: helix-turn-helix transcriptional regulator [Ramlibacter sp.]|nr:helix-turn-helix transcriptional regulator [Ramlibacter sp.]
MVKARDRHDAVNPLEERSLLDGESMAKWVGLPIGWVEAVPELTGSCGVGGHALLAMLDCGQAQAEFHYGARSYTYALGAGAMGLFAPGGHADTSRWRCDGVRRIMLEFDPGWHNDPVLAEQMVRMPLRSEIEFHDEDLAAVLRIMVREVADGCVNGPLFAESLSLGVAMRLQRRAGGRYGTRRERGKLSMAQARHVEDLVRSRLAQNLSIAELAQAAGFSPTQFVRLFKNTFACTPYRYILDARLRRARTLVLDGAQPLAAIAEEAGFSSQSHLTTAFVRAFHITPGDLRRTGLR